MTSVLDRLTDAMNAAAGAVRDEELRPLTAPPTRRRRLARGPRRRLPGRHWRQSAWAAPLAAATAVVLVIGLAVAVSDGLSGTAQPAGPGPLPAAPHRFYVATSLTGQTVVRSTTTGKVVATVPVPSLDPVGWSVTPQVAAAATGAFFIAAFERGRPDEQIFRFWLTGAGHVTGFTRLPGGSLHRGWVADSLAASPDASLLAVGAYYQGFSDRGPGRSDQLVVIHTATGAQSMWRGGSPARGYQHFGVASLSWAANGHELAVLGEWCRVAAGPGGEYCPRSQRLAQLRAINPAARGGSVPAGRLLLAQSTRFSYIAQALISRDGTVITAMLLRSDPQLTGMWSGYLSVERISVATGRRLGVLFHRRLGDSTGESGPMAEPLSLTADPAGHGLILDSGACHPDCTGPNGWLQSGRLIPLPPIALASSEVDEAW
jgi:hypothetical protein